VLTKPADYGTLKSERLVRDSSVAAEYNAGINLMAAIKSEMALFCSTGV